MMFRPPATPRSSVQRLLRAVCSRENPDAARPGYARGEQPTYSGGMPRVYAAVLAVGLFIYAFTDCIQATRTAYLTKPVLRDELLKAINAALRGKNQKPAE